jgi:hypothetical protein
MSKRTGATLVEVLVAIFIMGIGLLALLALFPLGVLNMAQAIQSDRAALCATNASSCAVAKNLHRDSALIDNLNIATGAVTPGPFTNPTPADTAVVSANPYGPSWPVFVDAVGIQQGFGNWVGGPGPTQGQYGIYRVSPSYVTNTAAIRQWFTLLDDIRFDTNAVPAAIATNLFDREANFSWAYLLRRPLNGNTAAVNMDIVVYSRRQLNLSQTLALPEYPYSGSVDFATPQPNIVRLSWNPGQNPPAVRAGSWILDATANKIAGNPVTYKPGHAQFYRVVGVNEVANNSSAIDVEVQDGILKDNTNTFGFPDNQISTGTFIVLDGVVEVIPRGTQWRP